MNNIWRPAHACCACGHRLVRNTGSRRDSVLRSGLRDRPNVLRTRAPTLPALRVAHMKSLAGQGTAAPCPAFRQPGASQIWRLAPRTSESGRYAAPFHANCLTACRAACWGLSAVVILTCSFSGRTNNFDAVETGIRPPSTASTNSGVPFLRTFVARWTDERPTLTFSAASDWALVPQLKHLGSDPCAFHREGLLAVQLSSRADSHQGIPAPPSHAPPLPSAAPG
jgi:hypothetical protein